jgi:hypothetical protein
MNNIRCIALFLAIVYSHSFLSLPETQAQTLSLSKSAHTPAPFIAHSGEGAFDSYLAMNLPFEPFQALWKDVEKRVGKPLQNRGEAHITVLKPQEYYNVLRTVLTMQEINDIANTLKIQSSAFTPICVGRAQITLEGKPEQAYYVVIRSEDLFALRRAIAKRYVEKGGEPSLFDAQHFYPHITLCFSKQDFHEEVHGVKKGEQTCFFELTEK